jgi:hypothetical protein
MYLERILITVNIKFTYITIGTKLGNNDATIRVDTNALGLL